MNIFGNCTCLSCELETRFLLEREEGENFYLLGDELNESSIITGKTQCDYCQHEFMVHVVTIEKVISAFLNQKEYLAYQSGEKKIAKAKPQEGLQKEEKQELKQFHESFYTPFDQQPFEPTQPLVIQNQEWKIHKIYKKESTEKDLTRRLLAPSLDEYWYEVENKNGDKKWCIVTDTQQEHNTLIEEEKEQNIVEEIKRVTYENEWYEFSTNTIIEKTEESSEEEKEHNGVMIIEPPFLKDSEVKIDVTDTQFKTSLLFDKKISENILIKAYQYLSGVRFYVYNSEGELELDLFGDTAEEALNQVQEHYSISIEEQ